MPAIPWSTVDVVEPHAEVTPMGSRLPLRSYRDIPAFLLWTLRIRRQLAGTAGVVGYALDAHLLRKTCWTVSAWTGPKAVEEFVRREPHAAGVAAIRPRMRPSTFVFWTGPATALARGWDEIRRGLADEAARQSERQNSVDPS
ncbi:hypothetical protein SAMN05660209_05168 [Geodermatophilus africanus]|uniref:DUF3291 domain-containing protein n=1 Tax=Geodermatophilus africanus TaxID=1137993 RepID=A0A1H3RHN7_9ACTN|nr:hypothetical protein [Geodermatophilus africanus]SDZ24865.1 hypothetical protein SAMN05660209_05168 [Geodermatophilus africanus]